MNRRDFSKTLTLAGVSSLFFSQCTTAPEQVGIFKNGSVIGCIGDSITYGGGNGWVEKLNKKFKEGAIGSDLTFKNFGLNSETITGTSEVGFDKRPFLLNRIDQLLEAEPMDYAILCYGMNDGNYKAYDQNIQDLYKKHFQLILDKMSAKNIQVLILSVPPLILSEEQIKNIARYKNEHSDQDYYWSYPYPKYDEEVLEKFRQTILKMNHTQKMGVIDIHTGLRDSANKAYDKDPIHPNQFGYQLIADIIYKKINENIGNTILN